MSNQYGVARKWSTIDAPKPFAGITEEFGYRNAVQTSEVPNEAMAIHAVALYGEKAAVTFGGTITDLSVDLPDISDGCKIAVDGYATGSILISQLVQRWQLNQPKKYNVTATHYPDATGGTGGSAGSLDGFTPDQDPAPLVRPLSKIIWSTVGLGSSLGEVHGFTITDMLQLSEYPDGAGKIKTVVAHSFKRTFELLILASSAAVLPAKNTELAVTGSPQEGAAAFVTGSGEAYRMGDARMITVNAMWFPGQTAGEEEEG